MSSGIIEATYSGAWTFHNAASSIGWFDVCYGNGNFVAIGMNGTNCDQVMTSPDGKKWTMTKSVQNNAWSAICFGNNEFLSVAFNATSNHVMRSKNGVLWTGVTGINGDFQDVCYGANGYVAVADGASPKIAFSANGTTWTTVNTDSKPWIRVVYGNGKYVAVSVDGFVYSSTNGQSWSQTASGLLSPSSIGYGNGIFVVGQNGSSSSVFTSTDASTWTSRSTGSYNGANEICYGNGYFTLLAGGKVYKSTDSINWSICYNNISIPFEGLCFGVDRFVAVVSVGEGPRVMVSECSVSIQGSLCIRNPSVTTDEIPAGQYFDVIPCPAGNWRDVCYGNGQFVAVIDSGTSYRAMRSIDGKNWITNPVMFEGRSICYSPELNRYVVGCSGYPNMYYSNDGIIFTACPGNTYPGEIWKKIVWGNGLFVAITNTFYTNQPILTSPDGINWTIRTMPQPDYLRNICYGNGMYIISCYSSDRPFRNSYNGIDWFVPPDLGIYLIGPGPMCYAKNMFVALMEDHSTQTMYSYDGINWNFNTTGILGNFQAKSLCYGEDPITKKSVFVSVGVLQNNNYPYCTYSISEDGINWETRKLIQGVWWSVCYGNRMFVALCENSNVIAISEIEKNHFNKLRAGRYGTLIPPVKSYDYPFVPIVNIDGVMEIGRYLDFHLPDDSTSDFNGRVYLGTKVSQTVVHNTLCVDENMKNISDQITPGIPVYFTGETAFFDNKTKTFVNNDEKKMESDDPTKTINCVPIVTSERVGVYAGIVTTSFKPGICDSHSGSLVTAHVINEPTIDFATHGDFLVTRSYFKEGKVGDTLLCDGSVLDDDVVITNKIRKSIVGEISAVYKQWYAVFKE